MYIDPGNTRYYNKGGWHTRGSRFLILAYPEDKVKGEPLRAFVRHVALYQCGHFMMGGARLFGTRVILSRSYGDNVMPVDLPRAIWERGLEVPTELHEAWNKGGGWNAAGNKALLMVEWAHANIDKLVRKHSLNRR